MHYVHQIRFVYNFIYILSKTQFLNQGYRQLHQLNTVFLFQSSPNEDVEDGISMLLMTGSNSSLPCDLEFELLNSSMPCNGREYTRRIKIHSNDTEMDVCEPLNCLRSNNFSGLELLNYEIQSLQVSLINENESDLCNMTTSPPLVTTPTPPVTSNPSGSDSSLSTFFKNMIIVMACSGGGGGLVVTVCVVIAFCVKLRVDSSRDKKSR